LTSKQTTNDAASGVQSAFTSALTSAMTARAEHGSEIDPIFSGKRIHFIGIGGCGMSGLALMLRTRGALVTGSDQSDGEAIDRLLDAGIPVRVGPAMQSLPMDTELVIASAAIKPDHPEILAAQAKSIEWISYAEGLGLAQRGRTAVSIAGTHGKSTTTAMTSWVALHCGLDPSVIVGATCAQIGGGSRTGARAIPQGRERGQPGVLVCEACEFNRSFHQHRPTIGYIGNIEEDHLDYYSSLTEIIGSFRDFAKLLPPAELGGKLLIADEGAHRREVAAGLDCEVATFGFSPSADYQVVHDAKVNRVGVLREGHWIAQWTNRMPGAHNALNSAAAGIINHWLGADWDDIAAGLAQFNGLDRRSQRLGTRILAQGATVDVFDDYGHHPTECEKTLRALRSAHNPRRLICIFQPHQHSRTRFLLDQFATSFRDADLVVVPHIYFVRDSEAERQRVSAQDLVDRLRGQGKDAIHIGNFSEIVDFLDTHCVEGDMVLTMGAGPVYQVAKQFLERGVGGTGAAEAVA